MKETDFARYLTQFLSTYLPGQVGSKQNTQLAYRDSFSLFLRYCRDQENLSPEKLTIAKIDRELILRFLQWLEDKRNCKAATRNQRLAAIHSFFSFLMVEEPQYMQQSQKILAIPMKKTDKPPLMYLPLDSIRGLLEQPDRTTIQGKRDTVLLSLLYDTGARVQDDDDKIRLNQRKPSKYKGLRRFGPEKNLQRINKFMKERPIFYKNLIQMKENIRFYLRCFYCITKVMILQFNSENRTELARNG